MIQSRTNLFSLIKHGADYLKQHEIKNPKKEIEWFCQFFFQLPLHQIKSDYNICLNKDEQKTLKIFFEF